MMFERERNMRERDNFLPQSEGRMCFPPGGNLSHSHSHSAHLSPKGEGMRSVINKLKIKSKKGFQALWDVFLLRTLEQTLLSK